MKGWMGLCLALAFVAGGCANPPSVAFSPDGKKVACAEPHVGLVIRELGNQKVIGRFEVGNVADLTWSPSGRSLIWSDTPQYSSGGAANSKLRELDVQSGKLQLLPVHMVGPFGWSSDEKSISGFFYPPVNNKNKLSQTQLSTYHFDSKSSERKDIGEVTPIGFVPNSREAVLWSDSELYSLVDGRKAEITGFPHNSVPSAITFASDIGMLISENTWLRTQLKNSAVFVDLQGRQRSMSLPSWLELSTPRRRTLTRLAAISPDESWAIVVRYEDFSKQPILPFVMREFSEMEESNSGTSQRTQSRLDQGRVRIAYEALNLRTNESKEIGSVSGTASDMLYEQASETRWNGDGRWASVSLDVGKRQRAWIFDSVRGTSKLIVSAGEKK